MTHRVQAKNDSNYTVSQKNIPITLTWKPGSAETNVGWGGKLNGHLMASCVRDICTKNYQNLITGFQVTVENVGDVFFETQCTSQKARSQHTAHCTKSMTIVK